MSSLPTMFEPLSGNEPASSLNDYVQPNLGHALRIWWAYYWPTALISFLIEVLLRGIVHLLYENFIVSAKPLVPVVRYGPYVITYVVAFFMIRHVLDKTFRHFRLSLISNGSASPAQTLSPTFIRTLRVWWIFTWRTVLYTVLCTVFVIYPMGMFVGLFRPSPLFTSLFFVLLGVIIGGALSLFVIYSNILDEEIGDFQVVLLPVRNEVSAANPLATDPAPLG